MLKSHVQPHGQFGHQVGVAGAVGVQLGIAASVEVKTVDGRAGNQARQIGRAVAACQAGAKLVFCGQIRAPYRVQQGREHTAFVADGGCVHRHAATGADVFQAQAGMGRPVRIGLPLVLRVHGQAAAGGR